MLKKPSYLYTFLLALVFFTQALLAQGTTATVSGTVMDETGAVLPGVSITMRNLETGLTRTVISSDEGRYSAPNLPLGNTEVEASLLGFQTSVRSGIVLTVGREAVVDFALKVGEITEIVTVTGEAPMVDTTSSTVAGLVDDKKIRDLPLNGRSFSDLVTLQMGAVTQSLGTRNSSSGYGVKISVSGARPSSNSFLLDGTFVNDTTNNTPGGGTGLFLGVETLREFSVLTNTFSAEYGQSSGAIVNAVTKSGTNELRGSLFYFHRNSALDARNFFDQGEDAPPFRRHQFGGVVGGPIVANKTFFFGGYEGLREALGESTIVNTLTEEARQGIIPGEDPIEVAPGISDYFIFFPCCPTGRPGAPGAAEFFSDRTIVSEEDNVVIKIDHNFSDSDSVFVRYTFDDAEKDSPLVNFSNLLETRNQYVTIQWTKIFSPQLLNVARVGYNRSVLKVGESPLFDFPLDLQLVPVERSALPDIAEGKLGIFGVGGTGGGRSLPIGNTTLVPRIYHFNLFEYSDTVSYISGIHSLKFGADIKRVQANLISPQRAFGSLGFNNIPDFLRGSAATFQFVEPASDVIRGMRFTAMGFFVQDDIQLRPSLTLNLGLRYEPSTIHKEVNGKIANLRDTRNDAELTVGDPFFENPTKKNLAPRVGFAWDPFGTGKTSIRAGFGLYYNIQMAELDRITATTNPPFATVSQITDFQFPFDFDDLTSGAITPRPALELIDFRVGQPYRMQYNLNVQHEILPNTTLTVGYVGARGVDLMRVYNANQPDPVPELNPDPSRPTRFFFPEGLERLNPNFGAIIQRSGGADSYYNSLQISVNRRFSDGFQVQGSYTFARSIDTSSKQIRGGGESLQQNDLLNHLDTAADRAPSIFDIEHNLSINYTVDLPGENLAGAVGQLIGGWQLGGIVTVSSGLPLTLRSGYDACRCLQGLSLGAGTTDNRPDLIPGGDNNPVLGGPDLYFDSTQFVPGPDGYYGLLGRNTLRIPGIANVDFSFNKRTKIREELELQFRAELFNIFNRANFGTPTSTLFRKSRSTGAVTRRGDEGRITSTTTTSRQIQFGLKLLF